jgi:hypothetical protein
VIPLPVSSEGSGAPGDAIRSILRIGMPDTQSATVTKPYPVPDATAQPFHLALHEVVRSSAASMRELRECVNACVACLRDRNIGPAQMIISMKACAKQSTTRYPTQLNEHELSNADFLMEQIIRWSIVEYYKGA